MATHPELRIHINGHACKIGTEQYNLRLALRRALAITDMLRAKGVPEERMFVRTYGAKQPYRYNGPHQLSKDRRVEIIPIND
jgi:outer membrane protein OmpA-like peptidoglycan-associated protein